MLKQLVKVANRLDSLGLTKEADALDREIIRLATDDDDEFTFDDQQFAGVISGGIDPNTLLGPEVVNIKKSPSNISYQEPAASASPKPAYPKLSETGYLNQLGKNSPEGMETLAPTESVETSVPTEGSTEELRKNRISEQKKRQEEIKEKQRLEEEQRLKEEEEEIARVNKIIADVKYEDKESIEKAIAEFEAIAEKSPLEKNETEELIAAAKKGKKKAILKIISILKSENSPVAKSSVKAPVVKKSPARRDQGGWNLSSESIEDLAKLLSDTSSDEKERMVKQKINEVIIEARSGNKEALKEALAIFESEGFQLRGMSSKQLKDLFEKGRKDIISEVLGILRSQVVNKDRTLRTKVLEILGDKGEYDLEPQIVSDKFYLAKRLEGSGTLWTYVGEYDDLSSAVEAEEQMEAMEEEAGEEGRSKNEYAVYDGETASRKINKQTLSLTPSYLDRYYGMNKKQIEEASQQERRMRILHEQHKWKENIKKLLESGEIKHWQLPKDAPDFKDIIPSSISEDMPELSVQAPDVHGESVERIVSAPKKEREQRSKPRKNSPAFGSKQWMEEQKKKLEAEQENRSALNTLRLKEMKERTETEEIKKRIEERKRRKAELEALNEAAKNSPVESSNSPAESSS